MQTVLRLVEHRACWAVDHVVGDLIATVGRQAVQDDRVDVRRGEEVGVDLIGPERRTTVLTVVLLSHRHPGVGDQDVGAGRARVSVGVENIFDQRLKVRDGLGETPLSYQPDYLDPLGRTFRISLRKILY